MVSVNHQAHSAVQPVETRMFEELPHVESSVVRANVQPNKAIGPVTKCRILKASVLSEEGNPTELMQQGNDVRVLGSQTRHFTANPAEWNSPRPEELRLIPGKVLVQQVQAATNSVLLRTVRRAGPSWRLSQALSASLTASPTAARGMRPSQRTLQIKSQERPSTTSSNTCQTMIRVPLKVGWPWQIDGSATMCRPNSTRSAVPFLRLAMTAIYQPTTALASCTASLAAAWQILPLPHRCKIKSQDSPCSLREVWAREDVRPPRRYSRGLGRNERAAQVKPTRISRLAARIRRRTPQEAALTAIAAR
jgi:hypothetical protein